MASERKDDAVFEELLTFIKDQRGFDFTGYKRPSLHRRFEKRMQALRIETYPAYLAFLDENPDEFAQLFNTILINVTGFFRDPPTWEYLSTDIVPAIVEERGGRDLRIWSTGCSTGEEAYTLAMVFAEALGEDTVRNHVKIYATDVDQQALGEARHASYKESALEAVPDELRRRYFERIDDRYVFRPELRRSVIFGRHDLVQDPPISRVDLLSARNTLMYFTPEAQARVLQSFHFALRDSGYLLLGKSEVLMTRTNLYEPHDLKRRVFRKALNEPRNRVVRVPPAEEVAIGELATEALVRQAGFEAAPLAQIVIDREGTLMLANMQARAMFGLSQRDIGTPVRDLELSYRPIELRSRIEQAFEERHTVGLRDVEWKLSSGETRWVDVQVVPLAVGTSDPIGVGVTITDVTRYRALQQQVETSKRDLEDAYEDVQSTNEELETTNEELQSTNEELETTNEELQSTNEELETMNEELQSTNEELSAINDELGRRTGELHATNAFLASILSGIAAGVAAVDTDMIVTAWSIGAEDLWGLRADEAAGKNLLNLEIGLPVESLRAPIREALGGDGTREQVELKATNRFGREVDCRVTCSPLQGSDGKPTGAIILMEPIEAA